MSWTITIPTWPHRETNHATLSIAGLRGSAIPTKDGATEGKIRLLNGNNDNRLAVSEILIQVDNKNNIYTGQVAKTIQSPSRFPATSGTKMHIQLNTTMIASNSDSTCCADDRYGPLSAGLTISVPNVPIVTNEHIKSAIIDLLSVFINAEGEFDFLAMMQGASRANID